MTGADDPLLLARVAGSLLVVLIVAMLAARLARRALVRSRRPALAVRERIGLARDVCVVVLEIGDRRLLLGVTPRQVSVLADLDPADGVLADSVPADPVPADPVPAGLQLSRRAARALPIPAQRGSVRVRPETAPAPPLTRRQLRVAGERRRPAMPPGRRGSGSVLDPRTWQQGLEALRDLTARRG